MSEYWREYERRVSTYHPLIQFSCRRYLPTEACFEGQWDALLRSWRRELPPGDSRSRPLPRLFLKVSLITYWPRRLLWALLALPVALLAGCLRLPFAGLSGAADEFVIVGGWLIAGPTPFICGLRGARVVSRIEARRGKEAA